MEGAAKIINFAVWDGTNRYRLSLNTKDFTWSMGIFEETPFPPPLCNLYLAFPEG